MIHLQNSVTGKAQEFEPLVPGKVSMYVCGMTVYDLCHLGHARSLIAFDVIHRWFVRSGYDVTYVRNITDIDDKIIKRAVENGASIKSLTTRMVVEMRKDCASLNLIPPTHEPRATDYVPNMLSLMDKIEEKGLILRDEDSIRFNAYGRDQVFASTDGDPNFVLWKMGKDDPVDAKWESPYGVGRPGWHLECSAMANALLGDKFDIHGGGSDLKFPHHENEIAQSETAFGCNPANYWLHNGFVTVNSSKMAKSIGNFITIRSLVENYGGNAIRMFVISANYGSELKYSEEAIASAAITFDRLMSVAEKGENTGDLPEKFIEYMDSNFNTPMALTVIHKYADAFNKIGDPEDANAVCSMLSVLGFSGKNIVDEELIQRVKDLLSLRDKAKSDRDYPEADRIRNTLISLGVEIKDTKTGTEWRFK